jgi:hypothetical protein
MVVSFSTISSPRIIEEDGLGLWTAVELYGEDQRVDDSSGVGIRFFVLETIRSSFAPRLNDGSPFDWH